MGKRKWLTTGALVVALAVPAVTRAEPPRYRIEVIGNLQTNTSPFGLNNAGQVVGDRWFGPDRETGGFLYSQGRITRLQGLGFLPQALDINDRGEIVGSMSDASHTQVAFLYRNGQITNLSASLGPRPGPAGAIAVNEIGHAVGTANNKPFLYDGQGSRFISHPGFGGSSVSVWDLNDHDAMIGWTWDTPPGEEQFAFVWQDGELTKIPGLREGAGGSAAGINNAGQVVGVGIVPGSSTRPFLYSDGVTRDLGTLGGTPQDDFGGGASDINDRGWIVGTSTTSALQHAGFLYLDGRMHDLNDLLAPGAASAWNVVAATRVNESGQILAFADRIGGERSYSLLLSPVPEPQALALWLAGLALVGTRARARRRQGPA